MNFEKVKICKVVISIIISFSPLITYEISNYILNKKNENKINKNR